jgi:hypothetical protein
MKNWLVGLAIILFFASSILGMVEASAVSNQGDVLGIESCYTHILGVISNYSEVGYDVSFHAVCVFIRYFDPWYGGYAGFAINKTISFSTRSYGYWVFRTPPGFRDRSLYFADYGTEVTIE